MNSLWIPALVATVLTWLATAAGAAAVFLLKRPSPGRLSVTKGFSAGVMLAATFWSLLQPAAREAGKLGSCPVWAVVAGGFALGCGALWGVDRLFFREAGEENARFSMLLWAITLHNIPEGLAVGVAFGALSREPGAFAGAAAVALGIGLQNIPEGAAVALPLRASGVTRWKSFLIGQATGLAEPLAGVLGALLVGRAETLLPWALSFAAGTMVLVSVHDLIPQSRKAIQPWQATGAVLSGFLLMTVLDVMLTPAL